jgi:pantoate--beta-alanine ligase
MVVIKTGIELKNYIEKLKKQGVGVGFVPTMGALHEGHLSLVRSAMQENACVVVSIYVNPTQFNDIADFNKYPRYVEDDIMQIKCIDNDARVIIFLPDDKEIYPEPDTRKFDFGYLEKKMEGAFRTGHFNGVAQVVSKLFDIVNPDIAYFGQKDYQQLVIIKEMVRMMALPVKIKSCPIIREESGLAMSSRNVRLSEAERAEASIIYETLVRSKKWIKKHPVSRVKELVTERINEHPLFRLEYFEIADAETLKEPAKHRAMVGCIAVLVGSVRLIDNVLYNQED